MLRHGAPFLAGLFVGLLSTALLLLLTSEPRGTPIELLPAPTAQPLRIHVTGAVQRPGVYEVQPGSIVQAALSAAGGAREDAVLAALNLAQPLQDGSKVYVPGEDDLTESPQALIVTPGSAQEGQRLHLNEATLAELEQLPGIGPSLARAILHYRDENGPFESVDQLQDVPGIGPAKLSAIEDLVQVP